jgi:hypothetical protein
MVVARGRLRYLVEIGRCGKTQEASGKILRERFKDQQFNNIVL